MNNLTTSYLKRLAITEQTVLSEQEALHLVITKPPMPYFKYHANTMIPILFSRLLRKDTCTGLELASYLADRFSKMSRRAEYESKNERKSLREIKQIW